MTLAVTVAVVALTAVITSSLTTPAARSVRLVAAIVHSRAPDYAVYTYGGRLERWNPCRPIRYRVDTRAGGTVAAVRSAVAELEAASGLTFTYDGTTRDIPQPGRETQSASLVVAFARAAGKPLGSGYLHGGGQLGFGGFRSRVGKSAGRVTSVQLVSGYAVLDATRYAQASRRVQHDGLLHELGHAVGLDHAARATQIMYPVLSDSSPPTYSASDRVALAKVGRAAGCIR